ncbi:hypothetical protein N656DRAFT_424193 [Canariomyces notabilis]|uniref:Uncharacterized protein n=1 Tax=Canariomyces notabilis TaxID=2074819 RepID=A0AAN6T802_9PEZI|nr:hypothetical protein N656DRAFT_424193 [Canariomyces arenarius]
MRFQRRSVELLLMGLGELAKLVQAGHPSPPSGLLRSPRQPTPNPFDWLDLDASGISSTPGTAQCAVVMSWDSLAFPNARIASAGGQIECRQRLVFQGLPTSSYFTIYAVKVSGVLNLEAGAFVDNVEVGVEYLPPPTSPSSKSTTDSASNTTLPYGRSGQAYRGVFNLTMNLWPITTGPQTPRGRSSCVARPELALTLRVSVSRKQRRGLDAEGIAALSRRLEMAAPAVEQLQVGVYPGWGRCP